MLYYTIRVYQENIRRNHPIGRRSNFSHECVLQASKPRLGIFSTIQSHNTRGIEKESRVCCLLASRIYLLCDGGTITYAI